MNAEGVLSSTEWRPCSTWGRGSGSYKLCQSVSGQYVAAYIAYILPNLPAAVRVDRADQGSTVYPPTCVAELRNKTMELGGSGANAFCLALGIMVFTGYYLKSVVRKPRIICKPKSFISKLIKHSCPFVHELYSRAPNEKIVQNQLNIELFNVF